MAISDHPLAGGCEVLRRMGWLICRAFRRMAKILDEGSVMLAEQLGLIDAWPAPVLRWHDHGLDGAAREVFRSAADRFMATPRDRGVLRRVIRAYDSCVAVMRLARGNRHEWRLC